MDTSIMYDECVTHISYVTRLGNLLHFGQLVKACVNN